MESSPQPEFGQIVYNNTFDATTRTAPNRANSTPQAGYFELYPSFGNIRHQVMWAGQGKGGTIVMAGIWYEDFEVGAVHRHAITRTVTEMDNMMFSCLTMNPQPLHIDAEFSKKTEFGQPLMNSLFTLGLMIGISVGDLTLGTTVANLGMTDVTFPAPLFQGDTVSVTTEVVSKRESRSRDDPGIVELIHRAYKQDGTLVAQCTRQAMMRKRPADA